MNNETKLNQAKPIKKLVLSGMRTNPRMTIVDAMVNSATDLHHIQSINIMSQKIETAFQPGTVIAEAGKGWYTEHEGHYVLIDKYILLSNEVLMNIKFNMHTEDMKNRIDFLLETPKSSQFLQPDKHFINFYLTPQIRAMRLAIYAYKNQGLIEYFEKKRIEMIKFLTDTNNVKNAENNKHLLKELKSEQQEPVIEQKHGIVIISEKKKPFWK